MLNASTISPVLASEICKEGEDLGFKMGDGPVSGGVAGATNGTLTFMVGAKKEHYDETIEFLKPMGTKFFYCGDGGSGMIAKICNNMLLFIQMIGTAEILALGEKLGGDPKLISQVVGNATGACWSVNV